MYGNLSKDKVNASQIFINNHDHFLNQGEGHICYHLNPYDAVS